MPTRLYRSVHDNPTILDRLTAHEWASTVVAGTWTTLGALLCWTWVSPGGGPSTVISQLPAWAAAGVALALLVAGVAVLLAVVWPGKDATSWRIELVALPLGAGAWALYAVVSPSTFWRTIAAWYLIGVALRLRALWLTFHRPAPTVYVVPTVGPLEG